MASTVLYRSLNFMMCASIFAAANMFYDGDDTAAVLSLMPDTRATVLDEDLWHNTADSFTNWNVFANLPDEAVWDSDDAYISSDWLYSDDLWSAETLSSCTADSYIQPSKLRARNDYCPNVPLTIPTMPDFNDIEKAVNSPGIEVLVVAKEKTRPEPPYFVVKVDGTDFVANEPEYYCQRFSYLPFYVPVCGSGVVLNRVSQNVPNSRLLLPFIIDQSWQCPESQFFCCKTWEPDGGIDRNAGETWGGRNRLNTEDYEEIGDLLQFFDPLLGTGYDCVNLLNAGWGGYDSEKLGTIQEVDPEDLGIIDYR